MAFCPSCGSAVEGRFCAKCGTSVTEGGPAPGAPYAAPASSGMADNVAATLCYVLGLITGILFLVLAPYNQNKTIRFHAYQSIFVFAGLFAIHIGLMIIGAMLSMVHMWFLTPLLGLLGFVVWLGGVVLWVVLLQVGGSAISERI